MTLAVSDPHEGFGGGATVGTEELDVDSFGAARSAALAALACAAVLGPVLAHALTVAMTHTGHLALPRTLAVLTSLEIDITPHSLAPCMISGSTRPKCSYLSGYNIFL